MNASTIPERPLNVTTAVGLLYLSFGIGLARVLLEWWLEPGPAGVSELVSLLVVGLVFLWIYYMIGRGRNWARMTVLILAIGFLPFSISSTIQTLSQTSLSALLRGGLFVLDLVGLILDMTALVYLFQEDSSNWFKALNTRIAAITLIEAPEDDRASDALAVGESEPGARGLSIRVAAKSIFAAVRDLVENAFRWLYNTDLPKRSYIWRTWLIACIPSVLLVATADSVFAFLGHKDPPPDVSLVVFIIFAVLIAPWLETLVMWPVLGILKRVFRKTLWVASASGVIFGVLHVLGGPHLSQGVGATWSFFVLSVCFLEWRKKSLGDALYVTALVHTCQNLLACAFVLIAVLSGAETWSDKKDSPTPPARPTEVDVSQGSEQPFPASSEQTCTQFQTRMGRNTWKQTPCPRSHPLRRQQQVRLRRRPMARNTKSGTSKHLSCPDTGSPAEGPLPYKRG